MIKSFARHVSKYIDRIDNDHYIIRKQENVSVSCSFVTDGGCTGTNS